MLTLVGCRVGSFMLLLFNHNMVEKRLVKPFFIQLCVPCNLGFFFVMLKMQLNLEMLHAVGSDLVKSKQNNGGQRIKEEYMNSTMLRWLTSRALV